jgi:hypothetical protein
VEDGSVRAKIDGVWYDNRSYIAGYNSGAQIARGYREALLHCIEAFAPNYGDDVDKFVADMAIWKDSVERERALLRLNGLDTESLTKMFSTEGDDEDAD